MGNLAADIPKLSAPIWIRVSEIAGAALSKPASWQPLVRLMPDYSAPMPLWGSWQQLELPELLLRRLVAWQKDFDSNFH